MEKLEIKSGENQITVGDNLSGTGTIESPVGYTGDIQHSDKRSLLWETTGNTYETNIELSETIMHFDKVMIYGSGLESEAQGAHLSKNVYIVQSGVIGADCFGYSMWDARNGYNYALGCGLQLSGNSGHVGSSYYMGQAQNTNSYAAGKWTGTNGPKMLQPFKIFGIDRHPTYNFYAIPSEGGSVSSNLNNGYSGDIGTITAIPESDVWKMSALNITGAELTGNDFMFTNSNVTAQAEFEHSRNLTLENGDHGVLSADKMSGFSGDVVTVDATTDEGWYLSAIALTGAEATGFKFMFTGSDVTALGEYTDVGFPITYLSDEHVSVDGPSIYIPGQSGITLDSGYDTYYRISGYDIENGSIDEEGLLIPTGPCTIRAIEKINYFTATGNFDQGSNESINGNAASRPKVYTYNIAYKNIAEKYAVHTNHTGDISTSWYDTSNRWNPSNASAYSMTINSKMTITASARTVAPSVATAVTIIGTSQSDSQSWSTNGKTTWNYNKTITTTNQGTYGVSAKIGAARYRGEGSEYITSAIYLATGTTGTWTATGIAP